jgi:hypothetical protein
MTAKEHVLSIYPQARLSSAHSEAHFICAHDEHGRCLFISYTRKRPVNAWKNAWKVIQKEMLDKLSK